MSRTALDGFPLGDMEEDALVEISNKNSILFLVEVFFCIMSNHFHPLPGKFLTFS